ncbi:hypothetical protein BCR35DRAFT_328700 [Leucosporidium creatinivorum]|uniref:Uncharacterized protein n=1 Tax=Leucosporidium creatinivorum TaxID=106004 RepID=A0A1Y2G247_9BASI|nr:hypothetical protein BCR35DRAFT_328700 [Leucosporidium creatinivorum]
MEEQTIEGVQPPARPPTASLPALAPQPIRPPSPGTASVALRPPVEQARKNSRRELQKIDCQALHMLLLRSVSEVQRVGRALIRIEAKISKVWTVPQRAVRSAVKKIAQQFTTNGSYLIKYLAAVSSSSRRILNFVATCIRTTHGLHDFSELQDIKPVIDELRLLQTHWASLTQHEKEFGEMLSESTLLLEEAADPDEWEPSSELSIEVRELADAHVSLQACFAKVAAFFKDLALSTWHPPLLSPEDVKYAAAAWTEVEQGAQSSMTSVRTIIERLLTHTSACAFMSKEEGDRMLKMVPRKMSGEGAGGGDGSLSPIAREPSSPIERPSTTRGWKIG